jgi:hypothetical protein
MPPIPGGESPVSNSDVKISTMLRDAKHPKEHRSPGHVSVRSSAHCLTTFSRLPIPVCVCQSSALVCRAAPPAQSSV